MHLRCLLGFHSPLSNVRTNQGLHFCRCSACACDLVRTGRSWRRVPRGFKVVWKARPGADPAPSLEHRSLILRPAYRLGFLRPEGLLGLFGIALRVLLSGHRMRPAPLDGPRAALPDPAPRLTA
jgi:hypothetical protein